MSAPYYAAIYIGFAIAAFLLVMLPDSWWGESDDVPVVPHAGDRAEPVGESR